MERIKIKTEFIKLDQLLKFAGITAMGSDAKMMIAAGEVKVNGTAELQRGKKIKPGDTVEAAGKVFIVE